MSVGDNVILLNTVSNTKQIKPFLLLVHGPKIDTPAEATKTTEPVISHGKLFAHDPSYRAPTFGGKALRLVCIKLFLLMAENAG
jgi:hypothetical protein